VKKSLFLYIPAVRNIINALDAKTQTHGVNEAAQFALRWSHTQVNTNGMNKRIKDILLDKPVVVISNHRYFFDIFYLLSVFPKRKTTHIVISTIFTGFGKYLDKYLLPVSIRHHVLGPSKFITRLLIRFLYRFGRRIRHSEMYAREFNKKTIQKASLLLSHNSLVLYFPQLKKGEKWFTGIGHLICKSINFIQKERNGLYVIFAHIDGFSRWDFLRLIPWIGRYLLPIHITFLGSLSVPKNWEKQSPIYITRKLEAMYTEKVQKSTIS